MRREILILIVILFSVLNSVFAQETELITNKGFVFINEQYVEPPYRIYVEDTALFVNEFEIIPKPEYPIDLNIKDDPGLPASNDKTASLYTLFNKNSAGHSFYFDKLAYLWLKNEEEMAQNKMFEFVSNLDLVKKVEIVDGDLIRIFDYQGDSILVSNYLDDASFELLDSFKIRIFKDRIITANHIKEILDLNSLYIANKGITIHFGEPRSISFLNSFCKLENTVLSNTKASVNQISIDSFCMVKDTFLINLLLENMQPSFKLKERISEYSFNNLEKNTSCFSSGYNPKITFYSTCKSNYCYSYRPFAGSLSSSPLSTLMQWLNKINPNLIFIDYFDFFNNDINPGTCTLNKLKNLANGGYSLIHTHGNYTSFAGIAMNDNNSIVAVDAANNWRNNEIGIGSAILTQYGYVIPIKSDWVNEKLRLGGMDNNRTFFFMLSCYTGNALAQTFDDQNGCSCFCYTNTTNALCHISNINKLFTSLTNHNERTTGNALIWNSNYSNGFNLYGNQNLVLYPYSFQQSPHNNEEVGASGFGIVHLDTYCDNSIPAEQVINFHKYQQNGLVTISNVDWISDGTALKYEWTGTGSFEIKVTVHAEKVVSSGGGFYLDNDGKLPNGEEKKDDLVFKFFHKGSDPNSGGGPNNSSGTPISFIIDRSGSMDGPPLANMKSSAIVGINSAPIGSQIDVVSFSSSASVDYSLTKITTANENKVKANAIDAVVSLSADGATSMGSGMLTAFYEVNSANEFLNNYHMLSDGEQNTPPQ